MPKSPELTADDIKGVVAYIPTPVRQDVTIDRNVQNAVDLEEAARAADVVIRDGATAICLNGTFGELPSLTWDEMRDFTAAVIDSVAGRVPVFAGATTLNTRDTLFRARAFRDLGATGLNLGRGMLSEMGDDNIVTYYRDIAAELPEMAICLYDDVQAFKRPLSTGVYAELAKLPQVIACKYRTTLVFGKLVPNTYDKDLDAVDGKIKLMTSELDWPFVYKHFGLDAIWSSAFCYVPGVIIALQDALLAGDDERVAEIEKDLAWASETMIPAGGTAVWHVQKIPWLKARIQGSGYINAGPALPPYTYMTDDRVADAAECSRRDRELQAKYPHVTAEAAVGQGA
ncbi:MAG TPA: dihydrodipicolinate synthase family protein [Vicinamibacterales bacterium]|nr:dihydrodipicolinate synthase family protein [Vicinamibacterales bacterium]